ncbi:MAG TPA: phosphoribosylanthranilate isomerase [Gemmatimonadaceae bacterium]|nr:phosphoribosylanthranilate isomerase [Gemmatimonadaceae bacterium]
MTRADDAREAARLGAAFIGVIFAGGPRQVTIDRAALVFDGLERSVLRVGVFSNERGEIICDSAQHLGLHVVQLHGDCDAHDVETVRRRFNGAVWAVLRIADAKLPHRTADLFDVADAVLLDAKVPGKLGGTGVTLPWRDLPEKLDRLRSPGKAKLALAGGLRPENVTEAIRLLRPEIVDVSSGVETAPGIKDHARMRAFRDAVHAST